MNNYSPNQITRIIKDISYSIEEDLIKAGVFYRIYFRAKSDKSLKKKIETRDSSGNFKYNSSKKLRDVLGIRVILYFADDLDIVVNYFKKKFQKDFVEETIDAISTTEFKPTRINIIYNLKNEDKKYFDQILNDIRVDSTYELQFRTILSEGWHEIDHDFRYKCPENWDSYPQYNRAFNGLLATLETTDWGILKLFESVSYSHYLSIEVKALINTKLRLRLEDNTIADNILEILKNNQILLKEIIKLNREQVICLILQKSSFPLTINNLIYFLNLFIFKNVSLDEITPQEFKEIIDYNVTI